MSYRAKQSKTKTYYMPTVYVDQNGVTYNYKQIQDYEYRKGEKLEQREQLGDQKRIYTIIKIQIFGRTPKQLELF